MVLRGVCYLFGLMLCLCLRCSCSLLVYAITLTCRMLCGGVRMFKVVYDLFVVGCRFWLAHMLSMLLVRRFVVFLICFGHSGCARNLVRDRRML